MLKIVIGGQINKEEIAAITRKFINNKGTVEIKNDLDAAIALNEGHYNYYIGACNTGGALAMAMAIIGAEQCATISIPGKILSDTIIYHEVTIGKKAFGFTAQHAEQVLPVLLTAIIEKEGI